MTISNFAELREAVHKDVQLSTELFGERVTIQPAGSGERPISAHVEHRQRKEDSDGTDDEIETLEVRVSTDENDATTGGIRKPEVGLLLWRSEAKDPDRRPFSFNGNILARYEHKLVLEFERQIRIVQGRGVA